ncbi:MAG TPA: cation-translocating P-type ATPase, partial [Longimicrobiales bacterium]
CEMAAAIIRGAGLEEYYVRREQYAPRPGRDDAVAWAAVPVQTREDGSCEARLVVDGLRCASCVWVVERVLERTPGVQRAMVSYATGRTTLRWDPATTDLGGLAHRISALGYHPRALGEEARPDRELIVKLGFAAFASANVMTYYEGLYAGWWYGIDAQFAALFRWASLILMTPVAIWCASPFFLGAWTGLRNRVLHMDVPIALGVAVLYAHGFWGTLTGRDSYLDSLGMLVTLLLAGRFLEARGRRRAAEAAVALAASAPRTARRETPAGVETVPSSELRPGDIVDAGSGEELPADGVVVAGAGQIRLAIVTGEAAPVAVAPGDAVVAGTVVLDGAISVRLEKVGEETLLQRMAAELRGAADRALRPAGADRIAPWFTLGTLVAAALTFAGWALARGPGAAVAPTVAVLVVACPCALALARPLAAAAGLGAAARRGLLLRSGDALLALGDTDLVALDKTGTVTAGELSVVEADDDALRIAAALERFSAHPIARAIVDEAAARGIPLARAQDVREVAGAGISGTLDGRAWRLRAGAPGEVQLLEESGVARRIRLADAMRPDAASTVAALKAEGVDLALLTGDHAEAAERIAGRAGIGQVAARVDPVGKAAWVEARQRQGRRVLFAGDGLNDGPALAAADVGIAMATGAASSLLVADGVVTTGAVSAIVAGRRAARAARTMIRLTQRISIAYNVLAVGAAAAGWVNPLVAAVLMPLSSATVIWGAARVEALVRREERSSRVVRANQPHSLAELEASCAVS